MGLVVAYVLQISLFTTWVANLWQFELLGAAYLWLVFNTLLPVRTMARASWSPLYSLWQSNSLIALTDLFSLDSVTTAIAVSQKTWLVLTGATIGIITLRFMAGLFIRWLDEYVHLEDAGYITVGGRLATAAARWLTISGTARVAND